MKIYRVHGNDHELHTVSIEKLVRDYNLAVRCLRDAECDPEFDKYGTQFGEYQHDVEAYENEIVRRVNSDINCMECEEPVDVPEVICSPCIAHFVEKVENVHDELGNLTLKYRKYGVKPDLQCHECGGNVYEDGGRFWCTKIWCDNYGTGMTFAKKSITDESAVS